MGCIWSTAMEKHGSQKPMLILCRTCCNAVLQYRDEVSYLLVKYRQLFVIFAGVISTFLWHLFSCHYCNLKVEESKTLYLYMLGTRVKPPLEDRVAFCNRVRCTGC